MTELLFPIRLVILYCCRYSYHKLLLLMILLPEANSSICFPGVVHSVYWRHLQYMKIAKNAPF
jgi:hypothetical protein